jgi:hypothetical protein
MTPFALLCALAGLSHREAGEFFSVRLDTVKSWASGRRSPPAAALVDLRALVARQFRAAAEVIAQVEALAAQTAAPEAIELGYPADDFEARSLGWPCIGAWRAMAARVVAATAVPIILVPRGLTPATAAAADARDAVLKRAK